MDQDLQEGNAAAAKQGRFVHEEREERSYEDPQQKKTKSGTTMDLKLVELDPKRFRIIHETFEKRTYDEVLLKLDRDDPPWKYIEDTGRTGHIIHEIVIRRCYEEIKDEDE